MSTPAQVAITRVQPHGARQSTHNSAAAASSRILPITPELVICEPLFGLAEKIVVPPTPRSGKPITSSGVIGRISEMAIAAELSRSCPL